MARRIALGAQGLAGPRRSARVDVRGMRRELKRLGMLQIDSVSVLVRAHYMPLFSRLGPYDRRRLDRMLTEGELFESWAHAASLLTIDHHPLLRHRMAQAPRAGSGQERVAIEHPALVDDVIAQIDRRGPLTAAQLEGGGTRRGPWWGHGPGKLALERHFARGALAAVRAPDFTRIYGTPTQLLPAFVLSAPTPAAHDAQRELLRRAACLCGVACEDTLADVYRMRRRDCGSRLSELVNSGELERVQVESWARPAYLAKEATIPRRVRGRALLSPFDPLTWYRPRLQRLFGFDYRIEIYVPAAKRKYGYYVLPFLQGDTLTARVDLKAYRRERTLEVRGAWLEPGADRDSAADELAAELRLMASWLELDRIRCLPRGSLQGPLRSALGGQ